MDTQWVVGCGLWVVGSGRDKGISIGVFDSKALPKVKRLIMVLRHRARRDISATLDSVTSQRSTTQRTVDVLLLLLDVHMYLPRCIRVCMQRITPSMTKTLKVCSLSMLPIHSTR